MATAQLETNTTAHEMSCMEVWGGNRAVDNAVSVPGLDAWIYSRPWQEADAGGDLHYMSMCAAGKIARFVVADIAGHGESVADMAGLLRKHMRKHINTPDQSRFTKIINRAFTRADTGRFATALLVSYHAPSQHLIISNAGHPRPLLFEAATASWHLLDEEHHAAVSDRQSNSDLPTGLPLGVIEPTEYRQFAVPFGVGDRLVLYPDALIETVDAQGRLLGESGLLSLMDEVDGSDDASFRASMLDRVFRDSPGEHPDDDVTLLTLRGTGSTSRSIPLSERLVAIRRLLIG